MSWAKLIAPHFKLSAWDENHIISNITPFGIFIKSNASALKKNQKKIKDKENTHGMNDMDYESILRLFKRSNTDNVARERLRV